jgi:hypothetical protein
MKASEFCYWLQGGLELIEDLNYNLKQQIIIQKHINMVLYHDKTESKMLEFVVWLHHSEILDACVIKPVLNSLFEHIDSTYPKQEQSDLNKLHNDSKITYRC